jgi:PilZ domain-containing protein
MSDETPPRPERRAALRVPAGQLQAELEVPRSSDVLYLSTSGMMVRLEFLPAIGAEHKFTLRFPDRNMEVYAIVRNGEHLEGSAGEFRVGVEFVRVSEADRAFLQAFVEERLE